MKVTVACKNKDCARFEINFSQAVGLSTGRGIAPDKTVCASCGEPMGTVKAINTSAKSKGKSMGRPKESRKRLRKT